MDYRKSIIIFILTIFVLFSIANVSASEDVNQTLSVDNIESHDTLSVDLNDNGVFSLNNDEEKLTFGNVYVNSSSPDGGSGTQDHPFNNLEDAIYGSPYFDTIYIASGTYTGKKNVNLTIGSPVSSNGLNLKKYGDGEAIFDAEHKSRIFKIMSSKVYIDGLTFKNGQSDLGGAIFFGTSILELNMNATFINNTATENGGAVFFENNAGNSKIYGTFINNTAKVSGGAIYFNKYFYDSDIDAVFRGNRANGTDDHDGGGAILFKNVVDNVNIKGDYSGNKARFGGVNYFMNKVDHVTINGNYRDNKAMLGGVNIFDVSVANTNINGSYINNYASSNGGVNYFAAVNNIVINGSYIDNKAFMIGGVNYFLLNAKYVKIDGYYKSNKQGDQGIICFNSGIINVDIGGTYINNENTVIYVTSSDQNNIIQNAIFLNNKRYNIEVKSGSLPVTNTWFGNVASNRDTDISKSSGVTCNWYFLDIDLKDSFANISLNKLRKSNGDIVVDNNFKLPNMDVELTGDNIIVPNTETIENGVSNNLPIIPESGSISLTASLMGVSYRKTIDVSVVSFTGLQNKINRYGAGGVINLDCNYNYTEGIDTMIDGISIRRTM